MPYEVIVWDIKKVPPIRRKDYAIFILVDFIYESYIKGRIMAEIRQERTLVPYYDGSVARLAKTKLHIRYPFVTGAGTAFALDKRTNINFGGMDMAEKKFAGTRVEVNGRVVAKLTSFTHSLEVEEADVTGLGDTVEGGGVFRQKFIAASVGETVAMEGIALLEDDGQTELKRVAELGQEAVIKHTDANGAGYALTGFFTTYEEEGSVSEGVYTFSGEFRVNTKQAVVEDGAPDGE